MWMILLVFVLTLLYYVAHRQFSYWSKRGVPGPTPLPLVGNMGKNVIGKTSIGEIVTDIYRKYEGYPFVGIYKTGIPCLLIRDLDFIRNAAVKDFKSFEDNDMQINKDIDPLFGRNPFVLKGEEWRRTRSQLTPCFTSGKMKYVFPLVNEVAQRLVKYVANKKGATSTELEAKNLCSKFTIENVTLCAFGFEANCFEEASEFEDLFRRFIPPGSLKLMLMMLIPALANFSPAKLVPQDIEERIIGIVKDTVKYREENNIVRNDFLDFISQLKKTCPNFTDIDVAAHAASFIGDGFETSAHVMSYFLFELASNPEVQAKLREEINASFEKNNQQFTYESIQEMPYLNACLNESMRKNAPVFFLTKVCTEKYTYTPSNSDYKNITVTVDSGTPIIIPIQALHLDPKHFHSPEKLIPERFLNKSEIPKYTFLPFGEGPRSCLGKRFAIMQVKVGTVHLVKNFEIRLNTKTQLPLSYDPWYFLPAPKGGLWLNFYKI